MEFSFRKSNKWPFWIEEHKVTKGNQAKIEQKWTKHIHWTRNDGHIKFRDHFIARDVVKLLTPYPGLWIPRAAAFDLYKQYPQEWHDKVWICRVQDTYDRLLSGPDYIQIRFSTLEDSVMFKLSF